MLYNFRIDRTNKDEIIKRLKNENLLSQGWGGGATGGLSLIEENFRSKTKQFYKLRTTRIPTNLTKIREFNDSDIIVTPHLPEDGKFSIHIVDGEFPACYEYKQQDSYHLNHTIKIKTSYGLDGNLSLYNNEISSYKAKLQWLRLPILPINQYKNDFEKLIFLLQSSPEKKFEKSSLNDYLSDLHSKTVVYMQNKLQEISPSGSDINFESICELIIKHHGYEVKKRNQYNRSGGDVDLICVNDKSNMSPFEQGESMLFVQIKKHDGTTNKNAVDQLLNMLEDNPYATGCVMSLADEFSDEAIELAEENGVVLINGKTISELLLPLLDEMN